MTNKKEENGLVNHFDINDEMNHDDMIKMVLTFAIAAPNVKIDNYKNEDLISPCSSILEQLNLATKNHSRSIKKTQRINRFCGSLPAIFETSEVRQELDDVLNKVLDNIEFEKHEIKDILKYLKYIKKAKYYDNAPLLYITIFGLTRFHNDTSLYYQNQSDMLINELNHIGYIPAKKYDLPNEEYKTAIDIAIDRLFGKPVPLFTSDENKIKSK